jgi:release factor H-coupled RctB family protein
MEKINEKTYLIASNKNWVEGEALRQLGKTAELPGMQLALGLPDIHPGKGSPVGAAFVSQDFIYPFLIGNDIGCGMGLWKTSFKRNKLKIDKWVKKLSGLEEPWDGDATSWLSRYGVQSSLQDIALGTIGHGNHFAELQVVEKTFDQDLLTSINCDKNSVMLLVHSGSRGVGELILRKHAEQHGAQGLKADSDEAAAYIHAHDNAIQWAVANRDLIAERVAEQLGFSYEKTLDIAHNSVNPMEQEGRALWLHRKGAAPSDKGAIIVPGARGALSYLVMPTGDQSKNLNSLAHGAGRKWNRASAKERLKERFKAESLKRSSLGGVVICEDKDLLYEEATEAYKNIDVVVNDMVEEGLIAVIATLKPIITYKVRK